MLDPDEAELEVKELTFGDGSVNQRSIRIETPNVDLQARVRDWLEPRESAAVASRAAIDCHAQLARTNLVSIVCVTMPAGEADADSAPARYESFTLRVVGTDVKELTLAGRARRRCRQGRRRRGVQEGRRSADSMHVAADRVRARPRKRALSLS